MVECFVDASSSRSELYEEHLKRMPDILVIITISLIEKIFFFSKKSNLINEMKNIPAFVDALQEITTKACHITGYLSFVSSCDSCAKDGCRSQRLGLCDY